MKRIGITLGIFVAILAVIWTVIGSDWRRLILSAPSDANVLFWTQDQRDAGFRMLDRVPFLIEARDIRAGETVRELAIGDVLTLDLDLDAYMREQRHSAVVVLHDGVIRLEAYGLGFKKNGRWTSFSVAKSLTSTLVGAAVKDGFIDSLADPVSQYIPDLSGSAYDDVTIEQLLTMTSGVRWIEDYDDPKSDVAVFNNHISDDGSSNLDSYMKVLPRAHPAGDIWNYSTGETNLIGVLVREATGKTLADYLSEKVWVPYGMAHDATWLLNEDGTEISGCCIQATTRDFARFGQFMLDDAVVNGEQLVPDHWIDSATTKQVDIGDPGHGYGYQWWTYDDGAFAADGIFGQGIFIDPSRSLVVATNSSWTSAMGNIDNAHANREAFFRAIQAAIDEEIAAEN